MVSRAGGVQGVWARQPRCHDLDGCLRAGRASAQIGGEEDKEQQQMRSGLVVGQEVTHQPFTHLPPDTLGCADGV